MKPKYICFVLLFFIAGKARSQGQFAITYNFADSSYGWIAGFADFPANYNSAFYNLQADYRQWPANLGSANALFISGNNHSDDLFMFYKKQIGGLSPSTEYEFSFNIEFASKYPDSSIGIGGSPGNSVFLKVGASVMEPDTIIENNWYRMNIDKGDQTTEGEDAINIGDIAKPIDGNENYVIITRNNAKKQFTARSDENGRIWLLFGTDSGFEGETALYFTKYSVTLTPVTSVTNPRTELRTFLLEQNYPNPFWSEATFLARSGGNPETVINYFLPVACKVNLAIYNSLGQRARALVNENKPIGQHSVVWDGKDDMGSPVGAGIYFYQLTSDIGISMTQKMLLVK